MDPMAKARATAPGDKADAASARTDSTEEAPTRLRVLNAALRLMSEQGYSRTSISQIVKASAVKPASIYWAFGSKEGLFAAVLEHAADRFTESFSRSLPAGRPFDECANALATSFSEEPEFLKLLLVVSLTKDKMAPEIVEMARRVRKRAVRRMATRYVETLPADDPALASRLSLTLAELLLMQMDGAFISMQIDGPQEDWQPKIEMIMAATRAYAQVLLAATTTHKNLT